MRESLSNHFPLSYLFSFCKAKDVKLKGGAKHLVTNSTLFRDKQFRELVSKAARELEKKIEVPAQEDPWGIFYKHIQGAIKRVEQRIKKDKTSKMDDVSKRFQELSNKKTQGMTTTKEHTEWLQLKKELEGLQTEEFSTLCLQTRELTLKVQDCTKNQLLQSLKVKKQQSMDHYRINCG